MRRTVAALLLAVSACSSSTTPNQITVVSQNLYLGGDILSIGQATSAQEAAFAAFGIWTSVQATNFPARAKVIAAGIAAQNPDVIGLQEVSVWRTGLPVVCAPDGSGFQYVNAPVASTVVYDFLDSLQVELAALGLHYDVARVTQATDAEFCAVDPAVGPASAIDVRYTDYDVLLVRDGLATRYADGGIYSARVEFPIPGTGDPGVVVPILRGWTVVEVEKDGQWYRVFETHLEVQEIPTPFPIPGYIFQLGQAGELIATQVNPRGALDPLPTILLGDMNSQAEQPGGSPLRTTYNFLTGQIPFPDYGYPPYAPLVGTQSPLADAWSVANPGQPGLTWGFEDDLLAGTMSQRIDLVLTWGAGPSSMQTFGADARTNTVPPLHASDHLGVAATIQVP